MVKFLEDPMRHKGNVYFTDMEVRIHFSVSWCFIFLMYTKNICTIVSVNWLGNATLYYFYHIFVPVWGLFIFKRQPGLGHTVW